MCARQTHDGVLLKSSRGQRTHADPCHIGVLRADNLAFAVALRGGGELEDGRTKHR